MNHLLGLVLQDFVQLFAVFIGYLFFHAFVGGLACINFARRLRARFRGNLTLAKKRGDWIPVKPDNEGKQPKENRRDDKEEKAFEPVLFPFTLLYHWYAVLCRREPVAEQLTLSCVTIRGGA
ncbi:MAG: hypothetical protein ACM37Z_04120 [Deltaproteobacteria bacterium]